MGGGQNFGSMPWLARDRQGPCERVFIHTCGEGGCYFHAFKRSFFFSFSEPSGCLVVAGGGVVFLSGLIWSLPRNAPGKKK